MLDEKIDLEQEKTDYQIHSLELENENSRLKLIVENKCLIIRKLENEINNV